jgi:hypothetical protein
MDVGSHFEGRAPNVRAVYDRILRTLLEMAPVKEEPKKTSIHLVLRSACAGIATHQDALILTVKSKTDIRSPRIHRREQASANRWHLEVKLRDAEEVDAELEGWLKESVELSR